MRRVRKLRVTAVRILWSMTEPTGFGLLVYSSYRWHELLGIALAGVVLIGYGAIRGR